MGVSIRLFPSLALAATFAWLGVAATTARGATDPPVPAATISRDPDSLVGNAVKPRIDRDRRPIRQPREGGRSLWATRAHRGLVEPLGHLFDVPDKLLWMAHATRREAVDVDAFDETPNSTWFTNRNHVRAIPVSELRQGPDSAFLPAKPWTITHQKKGGWSPGFEIKDADGRKWLLKLDSRGFPQLSSGADMVARTLLHAAGYNVPHNEPVRFRREDLRIDPRLPAAAKDARFTAADLDSTLAQGAVFPDGSYSAYASLFLAGHVLGSPNMDRVRPGDSNDWCPHADRRELRGLFPLCAWLDDWDVEDHQFLDTFVAGHDSLGYVVHYILDAGSSLGASATGPQRPWQGFEEALDFAWTGRRIVTLGLVEEPWRRAHPETGMPAAGNFESSAFEPADFRTQIPQPAFRAMTDRDGYWGAKIVASFSDAQIAAAVEAAHYEDPRVAEYLGRTLIARRDKTARYWFGRVAPLDFFAVQDGVLRFHDLAVDLGIAGARSYDLEVESAERRPRAASHARLEQPEVSLEGFGTDVTRVSLAIAVSGSPAKPTRVELRHDGTTWRITRVRHG